MPKMEYDFDSFFKYLSKSDILYEPEIIILKIDVLLKIALGLSKLHNFGIGHYDFKG